MTDTQILILAGIGIYFSAMIAIGVIAGRNQSHDGFVIGSRNVGYIPTIGSLSTSMRDGMGIIFWFGFGAATGYGGLWLFVGFILALTIMGRIGPAVRKHAAEKNYITIGQMLREQFGPLTEKATGLIILFFAMMLIAVQLYVSGNVFATVLGLETWMGIFSVALVVGFYLFFGGYSTVIKTDAIQFFLILSLIALPIFFAPPIEAVMDFSTITSLGFSTSLALVGIGFFFALSSGDNWQKIFSARDDNVVKRSFPLAGVSLLIMTLSLIYLGMACAPFLLENIAAPDAFYQIFTGDFIPPYLLAFIAVVVMAVCMSTMDTYCYLCAATIAKNFFPEKKTENRDDYIKFSRIVMVIILLSMSVLALSISDVILFVFKAASILYILAPIYLFGLFSKSKTQNAKTDKLIALSVGITTIIYACMFFTNMLDDPIYTMVPVVISAFLVPLSIRLGKT